MSHKKFGPGQFSRFEVYWIQTDKQTPKQAKFIYRFSKEGNKFRVAGNHEHREIDSINSVQSSLKSYSLWVTLYILRVSQKLWTLLFNIYFKCLIFLLSPFNIFFYVL